MKTSPESFAMTLSGLPFVLCVTALLSSGTYEGWRIAAAVLCLPAAVLWLFFVRRFWLAWKEYQADVQAKLQERYGVEPPKRGF